MPARPFREIPFGHYIPDLGGRPSQEVPGYLVDAVGVRFTPSGYRGMPQLQNVASSVAITGSGDVGSALIANKGNGEVTILVSAWATSGMVSSSVYSTTDYGQNWTEAIASLGNTPGAAAFAQYHHRVYIARGIGDTRYYDLDDASVGTIAAAPSGATIARVRDHLVIGGLWDATDYRIEKTAVQWSAIGDPEDWPTPGSSDARSKEAGIQYLPRQYGWVGTVLGGEKFGLIFQERAITRMTYVGGSVVFEFDTFETTEGCGELDALDIAEIAPAAVVAIGSNRWVWANDHGVFLTDGYSVKNVSEGVIDEALFSNTISFPDSIGGRARSAAYDQLRGVVVFKTGSTSQLCYHVQSGGFSFVESSSYGSLFSGKTALADGTIQAFNLTSGRQLQRLDGANDGAAIQTGFIELDPGNRAQLSGVTLIGADVPGSLAVSYKAASDYDDIDTLQTGFTAMTAAPRGNMFTARAGGNFFAFRISGTSSEMQLLRGIRVHFERGEPA